MAKGRSKEKEIIKAHQVGRFASEEPVFKKCHVCSGQMEGRHENYQYTECGLDNVVLVGVLVYHCKCGEIAVQIPAVSTLHRLIALELIKKPTLLSGDEVRYLRKFVGYGGSEFADMLGTTKVTMSRWETGATRITKNNDRVLRIAFFMAIVEKEVEVAAGPSDSQELQQSVIDFAKKVKRFNLMSFLKHIKDVHEKSPIKIDPCKLAEFAAQDFDASSGGESARTIH